MSKLTRIFGLVIAVAVVAGAVQSVLWGAEGEEKKSKHTIKEVMKLAHKDGLLKKITEGNATIEEKIQLLDLYVSLVESKPEKGEMDSWHKLAGGSALAAAKVVTDREGAIDELKEATNCMACHKVHK